MIKLTIFRIEYLFIDIDLDFLAAHRFTNLWAFLCPGVFEVFDRVDFASRKISKC